MAIQPIDLQTLFTQMDKVAKQKSAEKEGLALQQELQGAANLKKLEEKVRSVSETKDPEGGAERIKDKSATKQEYPRREGKKEGQGQQTPDDETSSVEIVRDPNLGSNIDVSG